MKSIICEGCGETVFLSEESVGNKICCNGECTNCGSTYYETRNVKTFKELDSKWFTRDKNSSNNI